MKATPATINRHLAVLFTALILAVLVLFFPSLSLPNLYYLCVGLLILNLLFPILPVTFFLVLSFCYLAAVKPVLLSIVATAFPGHIFVSNIISVYILSLTFSCIFSDTRINFMHAIYPVVFAGFLYLCFFKYFNYEESLPLLFLLVVSYGTISFTFNGGFRLYMGNKVLTAVALCLAAGFLFLPKTLLQQGFKTVGLLESKWCITTGTYADDYTMKSGYSYSLLKEMISNRHKLLWLENTEQLEERIGEIDVLIMMTPVKPFTVSQIESIRQMVGRGGTLIAIADHTDLYGHAAVLNDLLSGFGIRVNNVALFPANGKGKSARFKGMKFKNLKLKTPSSISLFKPAYVWAWCDGWISEAGDYTTPNFFGELHWTSDDLRGDWIVGASAKYKAGQAVVFADSTIFANFCLFQPNNLNLFSNLIQGSRLVSHFIYYCGLVTIVLMLSALFFRIPGYLLQTSILILLFLSCFYYERPSDAISMYAGNRIDVYGNSRFIEEPEPNEIPPPDGFSTAYSNIARSGLYPYYRGDWMEKVPTERSLVICRYGDFFENYKPYLNGNTRVVILDSIPRNNPFGFVADEYRYERNGLFELFLGIREAERKYFHKSYFWTDNTEPFSMLAAKGVLSDLIIGNWWNNTDISPYRAYVLTSFYRWLKSGKDISVFKYPKMGLKSSKSTGSLWTFKTQHGPENYLHVEVSMDSEPFVYCGSGIWALYSRTTDSEFLVGGPELSDDMGASQMKRWAAKITLNSR